METAMTFPPLLFSNRRGYGDITHAKIEGPVSLRAPSKPDDRTHHLALVHQIERMIDLV
jgi:hypothetical protein